ncbi:hypothetical protein MSG28_015139 [Choristoneura fumiferana]|uniref:Uncharacterized protein n=1 Tax=Choristoneura fumiferana TaxID=7141 RepID=A0ACC0KZL7_CHOFU|nr:hypothetical protein MSG28_015139 [Choristoneura fumiferana]
MFTGELSKFKALANDRRGAMQNQAKHLATKITGHPILDCICRPRLRHRSALGPAGGALRARARGALRARAGGALRTRAGVRRSPLAVAHAAPALPTISPGDLHGAAIEAHVEASDHVRAAVDATRELHDQAAELHGQAVNAAEDHSWQAVDAVKTAEAQLDGAAAGAAPVLAKQLVGHAAPGLVAHSAYAAPALVGHAAYAAPALAGHQSTVVSQSLHQSHPAPVVHAAPLIAHAPVAYAAHAAPVAYAAHAGYGHGLSHWSAGLRIIRRESAQVAEQLILSAILACAAAAPSGAILAAVPIIPAAIPTLSPGDLQAAAIDAKVKAEDQARALADEARLAADQARDAAELAIENQKVQIEENNDGAKEKSEDLFWNVEDKKWQAVDAVKTAEAKIDGDVASNAGAIAKSLTVPVVSPINPILTPYGNIVYAPGLIPLAQPEISDEKLVKNADNEPAKEGEKKVEPPKLEGLALASQPLLGAQWIAFAAVLGYASAGLLAPLAYGVNAGDAQAAAIDATVAAQDHNRAAVESTLRANEAAVQWNTEAVRQAAETNRDINENLYWNGVAASQNYIAFAAVLGYASAGLLAPLAYGVNAGDAQAAAIDATVAAQDHNRAAVESTLRANEAAVQWNTEAVRQAAETNRDINENLYWNGVAASQNYVAAAQSQAAAINGAAAAARATHWGAPAVAPLAYSAPLGYAGLGYAGLGYAGLGLHGAALRAW